ncbi:hypothetical protein HDU97_009784 [Phlyctochytrium planicorne]|nr:hypothetical protein HDU97_009784 [Phlyctochytrium planicorne]
MQDIDYPDYAMEAATKALLDAGITYDKMEFASVGYCFGIIYLVSPFFLANWRSLSRLLNWIGRIVLGQAECALALGFEKMAPGSLSTIFANAGIEYMEKDGGNPDAFDYIAAKSHNHRFLSLVLAVYSTLNPYAQFTQPEKVMSTLEKSLTPSPPDLLNAKPENFPAPSKYQDPRERFGYNPAVECRGITEENFKSVISVKGSLAGTKSQLKPDWAEKFAKKKPAGSGGSQARL